MTAWHDPDPDRALLVRVTLAFVRRTVVAQLPMPLPPAVVDLMVADATTLLLPCMTGVVEVNGELLPLMRRSPPPAPELVW